MLCFKEIHVLQSEVVEEGSNVLRWVSPERCEYKFDCNELLLCTWDIYSFRQTRT